MNRLFLIVVAGVLSIFVRAENEATAGIEARFERSKPDEKRLAFYSLDWAMSLQEAKERAAKEHRPILVLLNTNITAGTNFFSGHT